MKRKLLMISLTLMLLTALLALSWPSTLPNQVLATTFLDAIETQLITSDGEAGDNFGCSVAISGDTMVVGAKNDDNAGVLSGSAYVFVRSGETWTEQAKLTASDGAMGDGFGCSVVIDGDTIVVGAQDDSDAGVLSGSAYVFVRSGETWTEQAKLTASDGESCDHFGSSVAISGDTAVVSSPNDYNDCGVEGSAYIFVRSGTTWSEQTKFYTCSEDSHFGCSVAISGDTVLIGAWSGFSGMGSTYVFMRSGTTWSQQANLLSGDLLAGSLGRSVAISGDTAVIGAVESAYIFVRNGTTWSKQDFLYSSDGVDQDKFGESVAISGDTVVVGAYGDDDKGLSSGSAYVFERISATWSQKAKLTTNKGATDDFFGISVAISGDTVVIGASGDDDNGSSSGSTYVYEAVPTELEQLDTRVDAVETALDDLEASIDEIGADINDILAKVDEMSGGIDYLKEAVGKLDVKFILQAPTKDFVSYHMGVSYGGLPVASTINRAFGAHYSADTGSTWIEITGDVGDWSMGDGHLRLLVDLPDADDYWIFQFVLEADVDGNLLFGTIHVENDNFKHWPKP